LKESSRSNSSINDINDYTSDSDVIDLSNLFLSVLKTWKPWLLAVISVSVIFVIIKSLQILIFDDFTYSKPIRLTFLDRGSLTFPNGQKFSYSDIVSPTVVQQVYQHNNVQSEDISIADLQLSLRATPYAPQIPFIKKRYEQLLDNKKLTIDQTTELNKNMDLALTQAKNTAEVLISLDSSEFKNNKLLVSKILDDIPVFWAKEMIKKGVLATNSSIYSGASLNTGLIKDQDLLIVKSILEQKLKLLRSNISVLSSFDGAQSITDKITGLKLVDLSAHLDDIDRILIATLFAPTHLLVEKIKNYSALFYYEEKAKKIKLELLTLKKVESSYKSGESPYFKQEQTVRTQSGPNEFSQITGDAIDKIVNLSGSLQKEQYKQKLNNDWIALIRNISSSENELFEIEQLLLAIKTDVKYNPEEQKTYVEHVKVELTKILTSLAGYFEVTQRIYEDIGRNIRSDSDKLYMPISNAITIEKQFDKMAIILTWFLLMVLTSVIVIPLAMIRNSKKAKIAVAAPEYKSIDDG
jgi:hypothetical protein